MNEKPPIPKLLITYQRRLNGNPFHVDFFVMKSYDLITFSADTNMRDLNPNTVLGIVNHYLFESEPLENVTNIFESEVEDYFESHNATTFQDGNCIINVTVTSFGTSKLLAFMLNENMMELLRISHRTGKPISEVYLRDGGKWLFKM